MRTPLIVILLAATVFAQEYPSRARISGGYSGTAGNAITYTTADATYYVSSTGSDSNLCTASGTSACLTIQGAINKAPKGLRHRLTINVAAGNFASFIVSGFTSDFGTQTTTAGILIDGTLSDSTVATGSATGTATAGAAGSGVTYGTLTDGAATWTSNDLRGRFLKITSGTGVGQVRAITSNTGTAITIVGAWTTAPAAGSVYAIQDAATVITSCGVSPPAPGASATTANFAVRVAANAAGTSTLLRGISVSAACSFGVYHTDMSTVALNRMQFTSTAGTTSRFTSGGPVFVDSIVSTYPSTTGTHLVMSSALATVSATASGNLTNYPAPARPSGNLQNSLLVAGSTGVTTLSSALSISALDISGVRDVGITANNTNNFNSMHIDGTGGSASIGIAINSTNSAPGTLTINSTSITDFITAIRVTGAGAFALSASTITGGSGNTTGVDVRNGGLFTFTGTAPDLGVSGSELSSTTAP